MGVRASNWTAGNAPKHSPVASEAPRGEQQDRAVQRDAGKPRQILRQERGQHAHQGHCEADTQGATEHREQHALRNHLTDQAHVAGAERVAHGHLLAALRTARK